MEENNNPTPTQDPASSEPKKDAVTATVDPKAYEELGKLKKVSEEFETYRSNVDPVLQTLYQDPDLFNAVLDKHNKRLGIKTTDPKTQDSSGNSPSSQPSAIELDNRNALLTRTFGEFEKDKGMDRLQGEDKKNLNDRVLGELKDILDPMGNKTLSQALQDVSMTKLPRFLEKAYDLATKEDQRAAAREAGKAEALGESAGIIGSIPSGSVNTGDVRLSSKEKEIAQKLGIPEDKYLENKKKLVS